jgi:hypothetical protein
MRSSGAITLSTASWQITASCRPMPTTTLPIMDTVLLNIRLLRDRVALAGRHRKIYGVTAITFILAGCGYRL